MKRFAAALAFLLLAQLGFPLFVQNATVLVRDLNGVPVQGADIAISYQKSDPFSFGDGLESGKTGEDGIFRAVLQNSVPEENSKNHVVVNASLPYWESAPQTLQLQPGVELGLNLTIPHSLSPLTVLVESEDGVPLEGASVYLLEASSRQQVDSNGTADFMVPAGMGFSGLVLYGNISKHFNSSGAISAGAGRLSRVSLPLLISGNQSAPVPAVKLNLRVVDANKSPLARQQVNLTLPWANTTMETDTNGLISLYINQSGNITAAIELYSHVNRFYFEITPNPKVALTERNETAAILPLLNLSSFKAEEDFPNCFALLANVTDPRTSLPLDVHFVLATSSQELNTTLQIPLPAAQSESGLYTSRRCIKANATVTVHASNKYESAQKSMNLTYKASSPSNQTKPVAKPIAPPEPKQVTLEEAVFSIIAVIIVLGSLLAVLLGRRYLGMLSRFMIEYIRLFIRTLQGKKR